MLKGCAIVFLWDVVVNTVDAGSVESIRPVVVLQEQIDGDPAAKLSFETIDRFSRRKVLYLTSTTLAGQRQLFWPVGGSCRQTAEAVFAFLRCSVCARFL
ncbi:MAG TPA: hypothetical protein VKA76_08105 [Gammaproteobacteria bacterium]|nr:hypothetical protein [Gammaproteobacteria bacterium]